MLVKLEQFEERSNSDVSWGFSVKGSYYTVESLNEKVAKNAIVLFPKEHTLIAERDMLSWPVHRASSVL